MPEPEVIPEVPLPLLPDEVDEEPVEPVDPDVPNSELLLPVLPLVGEP